MSDGNTGLQLRSLIKKSGELEISLVDVSTPEPADEAGVTLDVDGVRHAFTYGVLGPGAVQVEFGRLPEIDDEGDLPADDEFDDERGDDDDFADDGPDETPSDSKAADSKATDSKP